MHAQNEKERDDRNFPDRAERRRYHQRLNAIASEASNREAVDRDSLWAEAAGPGSYRWFWQKVILKAPTVTGFAALFACLCGLAGGFLGVRLLSGEILGGPSFPIASAAPLLALAVACLLLRSGGPPNRLRAGRMIATAVVGFGLIALLAYPLDLGVLGWGDGALRDPAPAAVVVVILLAVCFATTDRDPPKYRWRLWLVPSVGIALMASVLTQGNQALLFTDRPEEFSYLGTFAVAAIYLGYVLSRPDRGLARFMMAAGPGPTMARLLVPATLLIPASRMLTSLIAKELDSTEASFLAILDTMMMVILLLWTVTYASLRLQRFYDGWKLANAELTSQADVLTRMSEGVAMVRLSDWRFVLTNPQFDAIHGFEQGELIGEPLDVIAPPDLSRDELEMRTSVMKELAENGEASYTNRGIRKDGSEIWSRANGLVTTTPEYGPVLIVVTYDVTEERLARSAGRDAELRFRQAFEQSPIGMCLVSPDGRFEEVNHSFEDIVGYTETELGELTFAAITHPDYIEEDLKLSSELFAGVRDGFAMEKRYIRKNGDPVWVYLTVTMLRDGDGKPFKALSMVEDITERHDLSQQLKYLADHDPLTGLYNRRRFEDELSTALDSRRGEGVAILLIDLDNFKFVNDSYGHSVGDRLIVRTAELLGNRLRANDILARQGGDEFVIGLCDTGCGEALTIADELIRIISREIRIQGAEYAVKVTASIGVASAGPTESVLGETLMMQADIAMYEAKESGRNQAKLFRPGVESKITLGVDWAGRLRSAFDRDDLLLYAQPIVRLDGTGPPHFELFIRMRDRDGLIIPPGTFLPMAERHDLVQELDRWVIAKATSTLAGLGPDSSTRLSINLSGKTVDDPNLPAFVKDQLDSNGVEPANLIFEVTETSAIGNMGRAQDFSRSMHELGCGFALDDFGTGFASFYYLKHIAIDIVKIDGEFVLNLASDPVNQMLIKTLVEVSRGLGKETVAEMVEDARTLEMLRGYGVDFVQGYHLGRPMPLERWNLGSLPEPPLGRKAEA